MNLPRSFQIAALGTAMVALGASCQFRHDKTLGTRLPLLDSISYDAVKTQVFEPRCVSCHGNSGGVNLESYEAVKSNLNSIEKAVFVDGTMPKGDSLSPEELTLLRAWIDAGAPEFAPVTGPSPSPSPAPELQATYTSIRQLILVPRCIACHSPGKPASGVPLGTLKEILDSPRELVIPGNVEESGLWIALTRTDDKRMPPPDVASALSEHELTVIKQWMEAGTPE